MAPHSPPPLRQSAPQPTLAPSPTLASGTTSRITPPQSNTTTPHRSPNPNFAPPPPQPATTSRRDREPATFITRRSSAEAYANAHSAYPSKRDKDVSNNNRFKTTKPILEWISRKLGGGRRATISVADASGSSYAPRVQSSSNPHPHGRNPTLPVRLGGNHGYKKSAQLSPTQIFAPSNLTREHSTSISRSESHSLRSYSMSYANSVDRERRRELNNPYPSIPVPAPHRDSTIGSVSLSYLSRSRTPSTHSEGFRVSTADDSSSRWVGADEDASIRPFPPSYPASPTPSTSLLSPVHNGGPQHPPSPRPETGRSISSSVNSSDIDRLGRQSRNDSTDTRPTTILSFESHPHMAHIAQAPAPVQSSPPAALPQPRLPAFPYVHSTPASPLGRPDGTVTSISSPGAGLGTGGATPTTPTSPNSPSPVSPSPAQSLHLLQAPKHSHPHPRDNPHPSAPPDPNASTLTLASSIQHPPPGSISNSAPGPAATRLRELSVSSLPPNPIRAPSLATSPSVTFAPEPLGDRPPSTYAYDNLSIHHPSLSIRSGGWQGGGGGGRGGLADSNASVRAIRRDRRSSWESNESGWSWKPQFQAGGDIYGSYLRGGDEYPTSGGGGGVIMGDRGSLLSKDSYPAQSKLSRSQAIDGESRASRASSISLGDDGDTPLDSRFDLERVGTPITA